MKRHQVLIGSPPFSTPGAEAVLCQDWQRRAGGPLGVRRPMEPQQASSVAPAACALSPAAAPITGGGQLARKNRSNGKAAAGDLSSARLPRLLLTGGARRRCAGSTSVLSERAVATCALIALSFSDSCATSNFDFGGLIVAKSSVSSASSGAAAGWPSSRLARRFFTSSWSKISNAFIRRDGSTTIICAKILESWEL
eukprot:CAMPEP_0171810382 /NCGR_PEP_ID=MMETSP0991-20121206/77520_1 /TAXON_ID=483369 /ORGANISM="non described non described, Strain CCMP2098" /LENGTH=196 /DNA_ID=CAMNT_0012423629 /DNA_START=700 /DNA_END=1292 /DNA_ORIENTATION=+